MLQINTDDHSWLGKRGATSQRWEYDVICIAWRRLAKKFPDLNAVQRARKLGVLASKDTELSKACFEYIGKNFEPLLKRHEDTNDPAARSKLSPTPEEIIETKKQRDDEIEKIKESIHTQLVAKLSNMTCGDILKITKASPRLAKLAKKGKPNQLLSEVASIAAITKAVG